MIELTELYAVEITVCRNAETALNGYDFDNSSLLEDDAVGAAITAGNDVLFDRMGDVAEEDRFFPNWHGGKYANTAIRARQYASEFYSRKKETDEDGDEVWTDWAWIHAKDVPAELTKKVQDALFAASDAFEKKLDELQEIAATQAAADTDE